MAKFLRNELIKQQVKFIDCKDIQERIIIYQQIKKLNAEIDFYKSKTGFLYSEANCFDNLTNVGIKFIEQQRRDLTDFIFLLELLNKRQDKIEGGFYPHLNSLLHTYTAGNNAYLDSLGFNMDLLLKVDSRFDEDCISNMPLE